MAMVHSTSTAGGGGGVAFDAKKPQRQPSLTGSSVALGPGPGPAGGVGGGVGGGGLVHSSSSTKLSALTPGGGGGLLRQASSSNNLKGMSSGGGTGSSGGGKAAWSPGAIALIDYKDCHFVLMDAPTKQTLPNYLTFLSDRNVHQLVRCCEPSYDTAPLAEREIAVHEMYYKDGDGPPADVVQRWLALIDAVFGRKHAPNAPAESVAVHCVAGLGRAPMLIAIALIERCGMTPLDAVTFIRKRRRGAFNAKQLSWIEHYHKQSASGDGCTLM